MSHFRHVMSFVIRSHFSRMGSELRFAARIASTTYGGGGVGGGGGRRGHPTTLSGGCGGSGWRDRGALPRRTSCLSRAAVVVDAASRGFLNASITWPSEDASTVRSASSGVSSSVTTDEGIASPAFRFLLVVARAGRQHLHVADHDARFAVGLALQRDEHIDVRARHDEAGHADHLVHSNRDRAHAGRNGGRKSGARFERRKLRFRDRLVLEHRRNHAAVHDLVGGGVRARQGRP